MLEINGRICAYICNEVVYKELVTIAPFSNVGHFLTVQK